MTAFLTLLTSTIGRWIGGVLFVVAFAIGLYAWGHHNGAASNEAKWQAKVVAERARQDAANAAAKAEQDRVVAALNTKIQSLQDQVDANDADAAKDPRAQSPSLSVDGVRRLNRIR